MEIRSRGGERERWKHAVENEEAGESDRENTATTGIQPTVEVDVMTTRLSQ